MPAPSLFVKNISLNNSLTFLLLCIIYILSLSLQDFVSTCHWETAQFSSVLPEKTSILSRLALSDLGDQYPELFSQYSFQSFSSECIFLSLCWASVHLN